MPVDALRQLLELSVEQFYVQGDYIFREGQKSSCLMIFERGLAVEFKKSGEVDLLIDYFEEPAVFGESCFMESSVHSTTLYANEDSWAYEIDNRRIADLAYTDPGLFEVLYMNLGKELGRKTISINDKLCKASRYPFTREKFLQWDIC